MKQIIVSGLVLILIASVITIFPVFASPDPPKVYLDPMDNIFSTEDTSVGDSFTVNIATSGWVEPGLYSYQLNLYYDNALLEAVSAGLPDDHFMAEGPGFNPVFDPIHHDEGYVSFGYAHMGPVAGDTGSGVFGFVTFEIIAPAPVSCALEFGDMIWLDPTSADVLVDDEDGYYEFALPKSHIYLKVEPEMSGAAEIGDEVNVAVSINEVEEVHQLVGIQFKLRYCTDLLETKEEWVIIRPFTREFAPYGIQPLIAVEKDYVLVGIAILPNPETGEWEEFPYGSGILATIKFTPVTIPTAIATCELELDGDWTTLVDKNGNDIIYDHLEHGEYTTPMFREDLNMDRKVDIRDITIFAITFGSYPEHPRWDPWGPKADIIPDRIINIRDGIRIALAFGKIIPFVFLKVEPPEIYASEGGDPVHVTVTINEIDKLSRLVSLQFKLRYNDDLLDLEPEWVVEGDFLKSYGDTWFSASVEEDDISRYVLVGILILPRAEGGWPAFPDGTGTLATIKFVATGEIGECDLWFDPPPKWTTLLDDDSAEIRIDHLEDGDYQYPSP